MFKSIWDYIKKIWNKLKKIFVAVFNFFKNLKEWFRNRYNRVIRKHPKTDPISIRIEENLLEENYSEVNIGLNDSTNEIVVNTFYDRETGKIIADETEIIEVERLDQETLNAFGGKDMLILK